MVLSYSTNMVRSFVKVSLHVKGTEEYAARVCIGHSCDSVVFFLRPNGYLSPLK